MAENRTAIQKLLGIWQYVAAITFLAVTGGVCISGTVDLSGKGATTLANYGERLEFTMKFITLGVLWQLVNVFMVIFQRVTTNTVDPMGGQEDNVRKQANILQNSFEQFVISSTAQICLVAFINEKYTLRVIPWVNWTFLLGRLFFWMGYPNKRAFGIFCSLIPSVGMVGVCVYKFVEHLFFENYD